MAASACSTLKVTTTFAQPSLGKTTQGLAARKEAQPHSHDQPRVQRPCTDLGMEDDYSARKDVPVNVKRAYLSKDPVLGLRWLKSSEQHGQDKHPRLDFDSAPTSAASREKPGRRSAQDDVFFEVLTKNTPNKLISAARRTKLLTRGQFDNSAICT
jgi:hypothetical protein